MALDDDADDVGGCGPPLPPDDRLWRHPSEVRQHGVGGGPVVPPPAATSHQPRIWTVALAAGLGGAVLATAFIAVTGALPPRVIEQEVLEKVAVTPAVSSPMLRGESNGEAIVARLSPAIVFLRVEQADGIVTGSGVLFRDDGLLLTCAHVVAEATDIRVLLADGRRLEGHLVGLDPVTDLALIDVEGRGFPVAVLGTAEGLEEGAATIAIGSAVGADRGRSVTTGVISAMDRRVDVPNGEPLHGMIQTDAPIAPGSSGGALVDANGIVIGITTAVANEPGGRFGFATPIDLAHRVAEQLLTTGHMVHGWLGVEGADLTAEQAETMGVDGGALVRRVATGSPASAAGIIADDVITEVGGRPVDSISGLVGRLRAHDPGEEVALGYWRDGRHEEATVILAARP